MHSLTGELAYQPCGEETRVSRNYSVSRALLNVTMMNEAEKAKEFTSIKNLSLLMLTKRL